MVPYVTGEGQNEEDIQQAVFQFEVLPRERRSPEHLSG